MEFVTPQLHHWKAANRLMLISAFPRLGQHQELYRVMVTRYDKLAESFSETIYLATAVIWLT